MITISNISASYNNNVVLSKLSLNLDKNEIHGMIGLNGSGKTTLLNIIYCLKKPDSGEISFNLDNKTTPIAFQETESFFYPKITGSEYLRLLSKSKPDEFIKIAQLFDLPLNKLIEHYSTGMKKKLSFIGMLSLKRPVLMLDEPYNGIDLDSYQKIKAIILKLKERGKTIIITSHILESLTNICDKIHLVQNKHIEKTFLPDAYNQIESELFIKKDISDFIDSIT